MADVTIDLKLLTQSFTQGMDKVNKSVSKTNLAIGNMVGSLAADTLKSFAGAATTAFSSIFNGAKDLEQTTKLFATLTGSMADAEKVVNELRQAAAQTPFELKGLQDATTQLLTLKDVTAGNVIPTLLKLGDVAAVGSNDIDGLARVFVKVQSQGRVTAETLESLINQSPVLAQAMVDAAGVNGMGGLRKAMSEGKVSSDILNDAINTLTSEGGTAFEAMAGQSATLGGQMSNLSDTMTNLAGDVGTKLLPIFKDVISTFAEMIEKNREFILNTAAAAFQILGAAAKLALEAIKSGIAIYQENKDAIDTFAVGLTAAAVGYGVVQAATIAWAATSTLSFASVGTAATAMWAAITAPVTLVVAAIGLVGAAAYAMWDNWDEVVGFFKRSQAVMTGIWDNISDTVTIMVSNVKVAFADMALGYVESINAMGISTGRLKFHLQEMRQQSVLAAGDARFHMAAEEERTAASIKGINEELKAKQNKAAIEKAISDGTLVTVAMETEAERAAREIREANAVEAEALRLENKAIFDASILDLDFVFREEIAAREELDKKVEAKTKKEKLKFLKDFLGAVQAQKLVARAEEMAARGKHDQANALLDQGLKDAKTKSLEADKKQQAEFLKEKAAAEKKAKTEKKNEQTKFDREAKTERDRQQKGQLLAFMSVEDAQKEYAKKTQVEKLDTFRGGLSTMEGFMQSGSKKQFEIGKAAAIAGAVIDTFKGATSAYTSLAGIPIVGPGLGIAAAAAAVVAGTARVRQIKAQKFEHGGIVGGSSFAGDNLGVQVNSSEMILNKTQQTELFNLANGSNGGSRMTLDAIERLGDRIASMEITLIADDTEIARSTSRGVQEGIVIGESR